MGYLIDIMRAPNNINPWQIHIIVEFIEIFYKHGSILLLKSTIPKPLAYFGLQTISHAAKEGLGLSLSLSRGIVSKFCLTDLKPHW
jgi:hypothetical protein